MGKHVTSVLAACGLLACGCDGYRGPRLTVPPAPLANTEPATAAPPSSPVQVPAEAPATASAKHEHETECRYCGRTQSEWCTMLRSADRAEVIEACRALRVLGPEGRPHLLEGLDSPRAETRRLCFESLSLSDFKRQGEDGRRRLVKLAGDRHDMRIRERATSYLAQWHGSLSAR